MVLHDMWAMRCTLICFHSLIINLWISLFSLTFFFVLIFVNNHLGHHYTCMKLVKSSAGHLRIFKRNKTIAVRSPFWTFFFVGACLSHDIDDLQSTLFFFHVSLQMTCKNYDLITMKIIIFNRRYIWFHENYTQNWGNPFLFVIT